MFVKIRKQRRMRSLCLATCLALVRGFTPHDWISHSRNTGSDAKRQPMRRAHVDGVEAHSNSRLVFVVPADPTVRSKFGAASPVGFPLLHDAVRHVAQKANYYADGLLEWDVVTLRDIPNELFESLCRADILIAIGLETASDLDFIKSVFAKRTTNQYKPLCHFALDCALDVPGLVGPYNPAAPSLQAALPWTIDATGQRMYTQMLDLFGRWTSDDFCYALMLVLNQFGPAPVEWVRYRTDASWEKGPVQNVREFYDMIQQCSDCVIPCLQDDQCRECLDKLTALDPRDQANSYRTLVSYESDLLTQFSMCIFTKQNIFQCNATIPTIPKVEPMATWRGRTISESDARALLVGHLEHAAAPEESLGLPISWKVACGANVAYDQFPSQNQIFYPAARGRDMWYDPVFRVETLDGRNVWCKRHYKVRPGTQVATFRLSVSDNGVTSDEFWTIVGAADDLSWIVFHYAGAAKAVGLRYLGGLLCTPDGSMPEQSQLPLIWKHLERAGIQPWELYQVDNRLDTPGAIDAGPPPLDFYRSEILARQTVDAATSTK